MEKYVLIVAVQEEVTTVYYKTIFKYLEVRQAVLNCYLAFFLQNPQFIIAFKKPF
ncbi:hypothetical protein SDC9_96399 [bioreactor metagenome]|uniref:Uncharacterized protein n=1 Tax=bioreactor metagenome TaxID=1076179 RepID=A0A645A913_9ZZZZ